MQVRGQFDVKTIIDAQAIRDTNPQTSTVANIQGLKNKSIVVTNGLDKNVNVQIQGSADNITFINIGTAQTVNTATNAIIGENEVAQLKNYFPYLKVVVTAALTPTTGTISVLSVATL